jgi:hypothetical protein
MLSDPNVQKFAVLLAPALLAIPSSWVVNQLPSAQSANRFVWLWLKLLVEIAFFLALINFWPDVAKIISDSNATPQLANLVYLLYFLGLLLLLIPAILDGWQLRPKRSPAQTIADEKAARRRDLRQALMDEVRHKWIRGVLEKENSLYHRSRIELGLQACPDLVRHLDSRQQQHWRSLPVGTQIFDEFVDLGEGGTLLIVGEPGGGKTTLLLELARDLLAATAATDPEQPVPVVLNLSTWGKMQKEDQPIATLPDWLIAELYGKYSVRREVGAALLQEEKLVLLLDGLDEVLAERREDCVAAINQFQRDHGAIEIVVCCRIADYEALTTGLDQFRSAIYIRPLDVPQVEAYLQQAGVGGVSANAAAGCRLAKAGGPTAVFGHCHPGLQGSRRR